MYVLKSKGCIMINVMRKKIKFEDIKNMYIFIYLYVFVYILVLNENFFYF